MRYRVRLWSKRKEARPMFAEPNVAAPASLIADPTRAAMLSALLDGRALPAGELACASGVTAQTANCHLAKLLAAGFLTVEREGRHRYYRLAGSHVAQAIEQLAAIRPPGPGRRKALPAAAKELRFARSCYDHLAGRLGVAITRALQDRGVIVAEPEKRFGVMPAGVAWFGSLGVDVTSLKQAKGGVARQCLDWTERTYHLAGPLGAEVLSMLCSHGWLRRSKISRAVHITPIGRRELKRHLGVADEALRGSGD
jgi:DNA-binding transcriptional ArsR family regulator